MDRMPRYLPFGLLLKQQTRQPGRMLFHEDNGCPLLAFRTISGQELAPSDVRKHAAYRSSDSQTK
jgi:hypothetical protein